MFKYIGFSIKDIPLTRELMDGMARLQDWFQDKHKLEKHFWLINNLQYTYRSDKQREQFHLYMSHLCSDFPLSLLKYDPRLEHFWFVITDILEEFTCDQWCLSYYFNHTTNKRMNISLVHITQFGSQIAFGNGYELIIVMQFDGTMKKPLMLNLNDTTVICRTQCTAIQIESNKDMGIKQKGLSVSQANENTMIMVCRRIPVVHHTDAAQAMYTKTGNLWHMNQINGNQSKRVKI